LNIHEIDKTNPLWLPVAEYADICSWSACKRLSASMKEDKFVDWERLFVAEESSKIIGFCALLKSQTFPGSEYFPLIKWLFVEEKYRGRRISQKLIERASEYARKSGYNRIFLTTWHVGLYEKYGFVKICDKEVRDGYFEGLYGKNV